MKNNCDPENINLYDANNDVQENETFIKNGIGDKFKNITKRIK